MDKDKDKDKDPTKSSNKHRQEYTPNFKREAVNLVETSGKSVSQIARDLGISDSILYKEEAGIEMSMSRKGDCYDNALVDSFNGTLKRECVDRHTFATRSQARSVVFEYLEVFYNRQRLHSSLGYVAPGVFEKLTISRPFLLSTKLVQGQISL
jgi:transposase InsO family protein